MTHPHSSASAGVTPLEQPCETGLRRRQLTIGLPSCEDPGERRFPLTPEGAAQLSERGFRILMQKGAAKSIHYPDGKYEAAGVEIVERPEAFGCDIVVYLASAKATDIALMKRGAMLLSLLRAACSDQQAARRMLERHIIAVALDLVQDERGNTPFADILAEIDGRASIAIASSLLADADHGKGILLGGVAGIVPCETLIVGSGIAACAAARSAIGLGAMVRMFDSDVYSLRRASQELGPWLVTSTMNPRTLESALRTADVVVATPTSTPLILHHDTVASMKQGVLTFDLTAAADGSAFPSMMPVDLSMAADYNGCAGDKCRICYVHAGSAVARTSAMAITNTLITLLDDVIADDGLSNALKLHNGMQKATLTFYGKPVNPDMASTCGCRSVDISIFLTLS